MLQYEARRKRDTLLLKVKRSTLTSCTSIKAARSSDVVASYPKELRYNGKFLSVMEYIGHGI